MALSRFQRDVCRLLAAQRIRSGESYVAGGAALNERTGLAFDGAPPDPSTLSQQWRAALRAAHEVVDRLPAENAGTAVLAPGGGLFRGDAEALCRALAQGSLVFHAGSIRGAFPQLVSRA